jgi:tellurite methyltransferase
MTIEDELRWDQRYQQTKALDFGCHPRKFLVDHLHLLPKSGIALDLAMGLGDNAFALQQHGLKVIGVDISGVAVKFAKHKYPELWVVQSDLDTYCFSNTPFDVVTIFYYLNRPLLKAMQQIIKPGGMIVIETLTRKMKEKFPYLPDDYLLASGELAELFMGWRILSYREEWIDLHRSHPKAVASLVARR